MDPKTACDIINDDLVFAPGWVFLAKDATHLHGGEIHVTVRYPGVKTNLEEARQGYPEGNVNFAGFFLTVGHLDGRDALARALLEEIISEIRHHEDRELLRFLPDYVAPLHPHTVDGRALFGDRHRDATFGYPVFVPESATRVDDPNALAAFEQGAG